jgi:NAD(P)-dependent dehydrogenase (short-subunit alcohol dehydrogenase family)
MHSEGTNQVDLKGFLMETMTILITGATSGLGEHLATVLADVGATILVHGRDPAQVDRVVNELGRSARGYQADFASLAEVRALAERVIADHDEVDALINNAGVGFGRPGAGRELSADGHELRFAVNYLAPVLLTRLLLPLLRDSAPSRIINVGSIGQTELDFTDLGSERDYSGIDAYRRSKLALVTHTFDLADTLRDAGVLVNCVHPASFMDTAMIRDSDRAPLSTVAEGASAVLRLIKEETNSGRFFDRNTEALAHPQAYDDQARRLLREATDQLLAKV